MMNLIKDHPVETISLTGLSIAAVLYALRYLGWIRLGRKGEEWNGQERRECSNHPLMTQKVCALYEKLEDLDKKLDIVAEKLQYVLGALENRWGKKL